MTTRWIQEVARSIASGEPSPVVEDHLDLLLLWLSNPEHPSAADLQEAVAKKKLNQDKAQDRAYELLDRLLFADQGPPSPDLLCLPANGDASAAKLRYRRLVQVYHPDHHPTRTTWATQRTERINRAFDAYRRGVKPKGRTRPKTRTGAQPPSSLQSLVGAWWDPLVTSARDAADWAWSALNGEQRLRNRLIAAALAVGVLGLMVEAVTREEPPKPIRPVVQETIRVLPTLGREPPKPTKLDEDDAELASTQWREPQPDAPTEVQKEAPDAAAERSAPAAEHREQPPETATPEKPGADTLLAEKTEQPKSRDEPPPADAAEPPQAKSTEPVETAATPEPPQPQPRPQQSAPPSRQPPSSLGPLTSEPRFPLEPQPWIPPAASPRKPEPPTPPALPPQAASTRLSQSMASGSSNSSIDCRPVPQVLARFAEAYEAGALDDLMALYSPLAKENDLATWFAIRQTYAGWFSKTSMRRIVFDRLRVQPTAKGDRCAAMAVFQVNYVDGQSNLANQGGVIQFLFERRGGGLLILRVRY